MQAHRRVRAARRHNSRRSCGRSRHKERRRHRRHLNRNSSCEGHRHHRAVPSHISRRSCGQFRRNRRRPQRHNRRHKSVACSRLRRSRNSKCSRHHSQGRCNRRRRCSLHRSRGRCNLRRSRFSRHLSNGPRLRSSSSKSARHRNPAKSFPNPRGNGSTKKRAAASAARHVWRTRVAQCSSTFLNCQASRLSMSSGKSPGRPVRGVQSV